MCRELATEEVVFLIDSFARAAGIARDSGFDGIEVHAVHEGYLLDQFTLEIFNQRKDQYGGSFENRMRAPVELIKKVRQVVGKDFPVSVRYGLKSYIKGLHQGLLPDEDAKEAGRDIEEGIRVAKVLEEAGYDAFNTDGGTYDSWYWAHPPMYFEEGCYLHLTEELKKHVKVPVISAGKLGDPVLAERALAEGRADGVSLGRPLLTDPEWVKKVRKGDIEDIRPCIGCHEACLKRIARCKPLSCAVNPQAGRETEYVFHPASTKREVTVIGGGIAGMEVARVSALRGHSVKLFEASDELGGHVVEGSYPSFKIDDRRLLHWYRKQMRDLKIDISLNACVTAKDLDIERLKSGIVVVATGSVPAFPPIPGLKVGVEESVLSTKEALMGKKPVGKKVVIVGGGLVGCEMAYWLKLEGHNVTIVEALPSLMLRGDVAYPNKMMLLELLNLHKVQFFTGVSIQSKTGDSLILGDGHTIKADTFILATGYRSNNSLYKELSGLLPEIYLIGDAMQPLNIKNAVWSAYEVARKM